MADTHETIADIIAWLRRPIKGENGYLTAWRDEIADRLEAALKRELSKNVSKSGADFGQLGDAAKLREALVYVKQWSEDCISEEGADLVNDMIAVVEAALSAPPRNCDLYRTKEEAQEVFLGEACDHPCGNCWVEDINNECGVDWLLGPAKEKEGGKDEQK